MIAVIAPLFEILATYFRAMEKIGKVQLIKFFQNFLQTARSMHKGVRISFRPVFSDFVKSTLTSIDTPLPER